MYYMHFKTKIYVSVCLSLSLSLFLSLSDGGQTWILELQDEPNFYVELEWEEGREPAGEIYEGVRNP